MARAQRLADLPSGEGAARLDTPVEVSFATVGPEGHRALPPYGARLRAGDRISLRLQNLGLDPIFAWVFDVGVSRRIALVTNAAPDGTLLAPAGSPGDAVTIWGAEGGALAWPADVPGPSPATTGARLETLVVVLADRRQDLGPLESSTSSSRGAMRSALDAALEEVRAGAREVPPEDDAAEGRPLRYRVERRQLLLEPG